MKYVIDVSDIDRYLLPSETRGSVIGIPMSVDNNKCIIATNIEYIKQYTEPDRKAIEDEVWEFMNKLIFTKYDDIRDCFGSDSSLIQILKKYSYQEAKEKYDAWKQETEKIALWDEVIDRVGNKGIVTDVSDDGIDVVYEDGSVESNCNKNSFKKTGRHYPQIAEILESMR